MFVSFTKCGRSLLRGGAVFFFLQLFSGNFGCAGSQAQAAAGASSDVPEVVITLLAPRGVSRGAEICFNALDDNGNQLIDEGCGVPQGQLQVALAWQTPGVDVDLYVTDPNNEIAVHASATRSGLASTADCPISDADCHSQNFESVYLEEVDVLPGKYRVRVRLEKQPSDGSPLMATLSIRQPQGTTGYQLEFFREGQEAHLDFHVVGDKKALEKKAAGKK